MRVHRTCGEPNEIESTGAHELLPLSVSARRQRKKLDTEFSRIKLLQNQLGSSGSTNPARVRERASKISVNVGTPLIASAYLRVRGVRMGVYRTWR